MQTSKTDIDTGLLFFEMTSFTLSICARKALGVIFFCVYYFTISIIIILQSTQNYIDVWSFKVILLKRLDQSSCRKI